LKVTIFEAGLRTDLYSWTLEYEDVPFMAFLQTGFVFVFQFSPGIPVIPVYESLLLSHFPSVLFVTSQLHAVSLLSCYQLYVNDTFSAA
jgi:hypothetical protein